MAMYDFRSQRVRKARPIYDFIGKRLIITHKPGGEVVFDHIPEPGEKTEVTKRQKTAAGHFRAALAARAAGDKDAMRAHIGAALSALHRGVMKRDFSTAQRKKATKAGHAMAGGRYPIENPEDVHNAYMDWIRTGRSAAVKAHIESQAKRLGVESPFSKSLTVVEIDFSKAQQMPDLKDGLCWGWASVIEKDGHVVTDHQGDRISEDELQKAAHDFMLNSRVGGAMHLYDPDSNDPLHVSDVVESVVFTHDLQKALGIDLGKVGWFIGTRINDPDVRKAVACRKLRAFSIGGKGIRVPVED